MKRLMIAALALALSGCGMGNAHSAATVAATVADSVGAKPPVTLEASAIDEKALTIAAKGVDALALSATALVRAGIIRPGSPAALKLATALDDARDGVNAAQLARKAASATSYRDALAKAEAAIDAIKAIIAGSN